MRLNTRMKLKQQPDDFRVEELTDVVPGGDRRVRVLPARQDRVDDARRLAVVRRRWQLDRRRLSYGGLKDRHAVTSQYLTIFRGPRRNLTHERIALTYLGQVPEPYTSAGDLGEPVRRDASRDQPGSRGQRWQPRSRRSWRRSCRITSTTSGSARSGTGGSSSAREMVFGRFEDGAVAGARGTLRVRPGRREAREGDAPAALGRLAGVQGGAAAGARPEPGRLPRSHPTDFKGAVARLRPELQGLVPVGVPELPVEPDARPLAARRDSRRRRSARLRQQLGRVPVPLRVPAELAAAWEALPSSAAVGAAEARPGGGLAADRRRRSWPRRG